MLQRPTNTAKNKNTGDQLRGGRRGNTITPKPDQQAQATPTAPTAANPPANATNYKIKASKVKVELFPTKNKFKNRRFTDSERELEKLVAAAFKRPQRHFFYDPPTYPWVPPEPLVNFDLGNKF